MSGAEQIGADHTWQRIAAALDRIAPAQKAAADWDSAPAYLWDGETALAVPQLAALPLVQLRAIESQKQALRGNLGRMAAGAAAHDMLLWGARGMGKSALIRAAVADVQRGSPDAIALVQIAAGALGSLPALIAQLAGQPRAFVLFCDDLTFGEADMTGNLALRSLLDGGVIARSSKIRVAVTSNRRSLAKAPEAGDADAMHPRDERDNFLALADRFGLKLGFHPCDQATYLEIVRAYLDPLGIAFDETEACTWTITQGNRSGRTAFQFAAEMAGRAGKAL